jgi:hypothetical protein
VRNLILAACVVLFPSVALADQVDACVDGADHAQQLRDQGKLIEARAQLLVCGASSCPSAVAKQCVRWLQEVDAEMPTVSVRARDAEGVDVTDVGVSIDGVEQTTSLDGRPMPINPGAHSLVFHRGEVNVQVPLMVRSGEKNRLLDVQLGKKEVVVAPPPPPHEPPPVVVVQHPFRFPWTTGVFLGLSVAGFVSTGVLVAIAGSDASSLRQTCAPGCAQSDVDAVRAKLTAANVTMGVGIGALAISVIFLVVANVHHTEPKVSVGFVPLDHGGAATLAGTL